MGCERWYGGLCSVSLCFRLLETGIALAAGGLPPLWMLSANLMLVFFCVGVLFGNNNTLAMQPLGHVAGIGAAVVGSLSTLISMPLGTIIGRFYNGTVTPLMAGITILAAIAIVIVRWVERTPAENAIFLFAGQ